MKQQSEKTWKERPAREMSTAVRLPPELVEERAPPTAWRMRLKMSEGMKTQ